MDDFFGFCVLQNSIIHLHSIFNDYFDDYVLWDADELQIFNPYF